MHSMNVEMHIMQTDLRRAETEIHTLEAEMDHFMPLVKKVEQNANISIKLVGEATTMINQMNETLPDFLHGNEHNEYVHL